MHSSYGVSFTLRKMCKKNYILCASEDAFVTMLQQQKKVWDEYERPFAPASGPKFHMLFTLCHVQDAKRRELGLVLFLALTLVNP